MGHKQNPQLRQELHQNEFLKSQEKMVLEILNREQYIK